jgi:hypothetical protein
VVRAMTAAADLACQVYELVMKGVDTRRLQVYLGLGAS